MLAFLPEEYDLYLKIAEKLLNEWEWVLQMYDSEAGDLYSELLTKKEVFSNEIYSSYNLCNKLDYSKSYYIYENQIIEISDKIAYHASRCPAKYKTDTSNILLGFNYYKYY